MSLLLNELSLHGQFVGINDFIAAIEVVMLCKKECEDGNRRVFCCDALRTVSVTPSLTYSDAVNGISDRTRKYALIRWFDLSNWSRERLHDPQQCFECDGNLVTEYSLAEAACRTANGAATGLLSFSPSHFVKTPLSVRNLDETNGEVDIENVWSVTGVRDILGKWDNAEQAVLIETWEQLIDWGRRFCPKLQFPDYILDPLVGVPFYAAVARQAQERLKILNSLMNSVDEQGNRSPVGHELYQNHFTGDRAWFSDESPTNKNKFARELTFIDPAEPDSPKFCPWHGKISTQLFRIHFAWPIPVGQGRMLIAYIGPKITKR